jgi:UPF0271 protein
MNSTLKIEKKAVVLDTSALVAGFDPFSISEEQYTVPSVIEEVSRNSIFSLRFETAIESGRVTVTSPKADFLSKVKASASAVGDAFFLSDTDIQVLALALELKTNGYRPLVATDDYSIQNVANQMKIEFASLVTFGIRRRLQWVRYCPACHRKYPEEYKDNRCKICGTQLKRKPVKEDRINRQDKT